MQTRNVRAFVFGRPRLEDVLVVVGADGGSVGRRHEAGVTRIVDLAADLVVERDREIDAVGRNRGREAAVYRRNRAVVQVAGRGGVVRSLGPGDLAVVALHVLVPERSARFGIDAGVRTQVIGVERQPFADEITAVDIAFVALHGRGFVFGSQIGDLILHMGQVQVEAPQHVFRADQVGVQLPLDAAVDHVAHVGVIGRVTQRRRNRECEEHVRSLAVEEIDASAQAVVPETELRTDVQVGVGLPRNVGIAFLPEEHGDFAVVVLDRIGVGVEVVADGAVADVIVALRTVGSLELQ